jgi:hypothetical protein
VKLRLALYAIGVGFVLLGLFGLLTAADVEPKGWAMWFVGVAVVHDGILVPCVLLIGALTTRVPSPYKRPIQWTLLVGGVVGLVALPFVLGYGRRADNPSVLPLSYGRNLLIVLAVIVVLAVIWHFWQTHRRRSNDG